LSVVITPLFRRTPLAAALALTFGAPLWAQETPARAVITAEAEETSAPAGSPKTGPTHDAAATRLPAVKVKEQADRGYAPETLSSPKYTAPLLDTPQNITVIPKEVITDQNVLTLREILGNVPGVTFGAGEGGGGYGDSINLRGYSANSDILVDGVRDSAQTSRSDPFNLQQVEVFKGPNSAYAGAGSVAGNINLVSKTPELDDFMNFTGALGTDAYYRSTADINHRLGPTMAARLNVMGHSNEVAERDYVENERWGVAPSISFGLGTPTQFTLAYFHQEDDNIPDYGIPFRNFERVPGIDRSNFYGYRGIDEQDIETDLVTATFQHAFTDKLRVRNLWRWGQIDNLTIASGIQGRVCIEAGQLPLGVTSGDACAASGTYEPSGGPRALLRDYRNTLMANQTDLTYEFNTGPIAHTLVAGVQIVNEDYDRDGASSLFRDAGGVIPTLPPTDLYDPDLQFDGELNYSLTDRTKADLKSQAFYLLDTIELTEKWQITGGMRFEHSSAQIAALPPTTATSRISTKDDLFSGRVGLVYKPVANGSLYVAYGESKNPASITIISNPRPGNDGSLSLNNANVKPEKTESIEVGAKWNLFQDRLQLTGALFQNDRTNTRVASGDPLAPEQVLDGESRVKGFELGASGQVTNELSVYFTYAYLDSEILQSISDGDEDDGDVDPQKGHALPATPQNSGNLWVTYALPRGFEVGYGAQYVGEWHQTAVDPDKIEDFWLQNALVGYRVNRHLHVRVNVNNVANETYYNRVRGNVVGWADPGVGRTTVMTATLNF
jgi:catecholate siderophore receptor